MLGIAEVLNLLWNNLLGIYRAWTPGDPPHSENTWVDTCNLIFWHSSSSLEKTIPKFTGVIESSVSLLCSFKYNPGFRFELCDNGISANSFSGDGLAGSSRCKSELDVFPPVVQEHLHRLQWQGCLLARGASCKDTERLIPPQLTVCWRINASFIQNYTVWSLLIASHLKAWCNAHWSQRLFFFCLHRLWIIALLKTLNLWVFQAVGSNSLTCCIFHS